MNRPHPFSPAQIIADAVIDGATLVETGRIASLARQGLEDPASLTGVQARQVFAAFLLLFDPNVWLRGQPVRPAPDYWAVPESGPVLTGVGLEAVEAAAVGALAQPCGDGVQGLA